MNELSDRIIDALYRAHLIQEPDLRQAMKIVDEILSNPPPPNKEFEFTK